MLFQNRVWRVLLVTAIFVVVGPPVGGVVSWMSMGAAFSLRSPVPFVTGSYGEGMILALSSGLIVAFAGLWLALRSWPVPIVAALVSNALFFVLTADMDLSRADYVSALYNMGRVFLPPSIVAALVCWFMARPLLRAEGQ
ncbi:hypothetical protein [Taklimakanibacter albus]|uniref:Uncharacterized protein n=1 Tax=Taklimakanibacter albus TaxID=2800327 RepID=A0ACC5R411_9HYPH|nr:hypothetical protein [Aestuariivirga sp. YIM B02566]MBK1867406.1 hypothetical protein [Aestuariivirga sp. YIM B02566]